MEEFTGLLCLFGLIAPVYLVRAIVALRQKRVTESLPDVCLCETTGLLVRWNRLRVNSQHWYLATIQYDATFELVTVKRRYAYKFCATGQTVRVRYNSCKIRQMYTPDMPFIESNAAHEFVCFLIAAAVFCAVWWMLSNVS